MNILDTILLTETQHFAATERKDLAVSAGAGSGKTNTLTARYLHLVDENAAPRRVVAITFTEKATREMRNRIRSQIHHWIENECPPEEQARWRAIEAGLDAAHIGTIHALCAEILRAHPAEAEIDPRFGVLDEGLSAALQAQVVSDSLAWATGQPDLIPLFESFTPATLETILSSLLKQRLEVETLLNLTVSGDQALARELRTFLDLPPVQEAWDTLRALFDDGTLLADAGDKLAAQVEQLLLKWDALERALRDTRASEAALCLYQIRRECLKKNVGKKTSAAKANIAVLQAAYDEILDPWLGGKSDDGAPDPALDVHMRELVALLRVLFEHAQGEYRRAKDQRAELDFDDMERGAQKLLQRPEIRAQWQAQIDALLVDEFQDTNERQREIIEALAGSADGRIGCLFIVGDPKQSIYRFRGADVTVFARVREDIRRRGGLPVDLSETFRAHTDLIETLNLLLANVMDSASPRRAYYTPFAKLKSSRAEPPDYQPPFVELLYGLGDDSRRTAAQLLARRLRELHDTHGVAWDKIVCLFRASTGFDEYESAFADARIPFVTVAGRGFYERPEIRDLLNMLRALSDPSDDLALAGLLRSPAFGLSDAALYQLRWIEEKQPRSYWDALYQDLSALSETDRARAETARQVILKSTALVGRVSVAELLKAILFETNYLALLAAATGERLQRNVEKLLSDAYASGLTGVTEFLEYIETLRDVGAREGEAPSEAEGAVRLMTVHKAKGLQFPIVVLADAARGFPSFRGHVLLSDELGVVPRVETEAGISALFALAKGFEQDRAQAEDLRLLYVAATRAQEKLIVCAHESRRADAWFHKLVAAADLSMDDVSAEPDAWHERALHDSALKISWRASTAGASAKPDAEPPPAPEQIAAPLFAPLQPPRDLETPDDDKTLEELLSVDNANFQIGILFHAAIRQWAFPGDPTLELLLRAASANFSLPALNLLPRVRTLLERVQHDPRWGELNAAPVRRHEVPFTFTDGALVNNGTIDLLYQTPAGAWHIVDFKTEVISRAELPGIVKKHRPQLLRYLQAARQINLDAQAWLCFADCEGGVVWQQVEDSLLKDSNLAKEMPVVS